MRCLICSRPDAREINAALLRRSARGSGMVAAMAEKLKCSRQVVWRHRKFHLKLSTSAAEMPKVETLEARARMLSEDADRLQLMLENGAPKDVIEQGHRLLATRLKLLEVEARLVGRLSGGKQVPVSLASVLKEAGDSAGEPDPEETERARKEFLEVCGPETGEQ